MSKDQIEISIDNNKFIAAKRTFSTGREGFGLYSTVIIGGNQYRISCNIIKL